MGSISSPPGTDSLILVIDDDATIRLFLSLALEEEGFRVVTAADGQEGLERVAHEMPALVVLDVAMPILDGHGFAARFRATGGASVPLIVVSAGGQIADGGGPIEAYATLSKPFELDELIRTVERATQP